MTFRSPIPRALALCLALSGLSGCSALSALSDVSTPLDVYELRAPDDVPVARGNPLPLVVTIETPTTGGALQTDHIMIRPDPYQAQYLPDVRWSEDVPQLVQTLMLRTLESTQALRYVGRTPLGAGGDYAIMTEITDFQAEAAAVDAPVLIRLRIVASLVRERDVQIIASRTFGATAESPTTKTGDVVRAFDAASDEMLRDFAVWAAGAMGRRL
ncbi:ABC-type transport auxiliary lipoprotein family protein [Puniceibacterium sediminis]|uniref:Cholesterol transport system auxiliary component n=1 Tax=Puniceibacterium sediminis TaxID=1608407 RepID=A0A238WSV9_9RHOB|nr:ABC-type transport auxiliary lipoprotein family protein [Puniceibacterium sediminis]SNR49656.1 cholesterol transport system auxiliary component [Puniceibacterium sediminis]